MDWGEIFKGMLRDKERVKCSVVDKIEKFVLVQFVGDCTICKNGVVLLEIVNKPKGFKDRIFEVNGEEFEVFKVSLVLKGLKKVKQISESLVEAAGTAKKKSLDMGNPEECIRKSVFQRIEKVLDDRICAIKVWKFSKKFGKEIFISFCVEVQSWVISIGKKCVLYKENHFSGNFGNKPSYSKTKEFLKTILTDALQLGILGLTLHGFIPYNLNEPIKFLGLIPLDLSSLYLDLDSTLAFMETYSLSFVNPAIIGEFHTATEIFKALFAEFSDSPDGVLSEIYFFSEFPVQNDTLSVISVCKIKKKLKDAKKVLVQRLRGLRRNGKAFEKKSLETLVGKFEVAREGIEEIFGLYSENHPDLLVLEGREQNPPTPIPNGAPIILIPGYTFTDSLTLSQFLSYPLQKYKRGIPLQPNTIYEAEDITEKLLESQNCLAVFFNWDLESKEKFLTTVKTRKKSELPQNLMKYSKKTGEDALPAISKIYEDMQQKIKTLQQTHPNHTIELNSHYSTADFVEIHNKIQNLPSFVAQPETAAVKKIPEKVTEAIPICFIVIPMGIPGMGKTHIMPSIRKVALSAGFEFYTLSSDEIKNKAILDYRKKNLSADQEKALIKTTKSSNNFYYNELIEKIKANTHSLFIYLDKNHPPSGFQALHKRLKSEPITNTLVKLIALAPLCKSHISLPHKYYEFSVEFLATCIYRAVTRDPHLTLIGSPTKIASIVFGMLALYKNHSFVSDLEEGKIQYLVQVPFVCENEGWLPEELKEKILLKIKSIKMDFEANGEGLEEIVEEVLKLDVKGCENGEIIEREILKILKDVPVKTVEQVIEEKKSQKGFKHKKEVELPKESVKNVSKHPVYIGICVETTVRNAAIDILLATLEKLHSFYHEKSIIRDIEEILSLKQKKSSKWKYPNSYHITSMFIGSSHEKYKTPEFTNFIPDVDVNISITHIVYSPSSIACAKAEVVSPQVGVENRIPHITLLLGNKPAKYSNTVLQNVGFELEFNRSSFREQKYEQTVFAYKLPEALQVVGKTKYFY